MAEREERIGVIGMIEMIERDLAHYEANITVVYENLPSFINGIVVKDKNIIVLNSNIEPEQLKNAYIQKLADIKNGVK